MSAFEKLFKAAVVVAGVATGVGLVTGAVGAGAAFAGFAAGTASAYFATSLVTTLVLGAASYALAKKPSEGNGLSPGALASTRDALAPHKVIYGRTRVGGTIIYMESTNDNKYLHVVIVLAGHEIDGVEKIYLNDQEVQIDADGFVTSGSYVSEKRTGFNQGLISRVRVKFKYGTDSQTAFEDLVSESDSSWTVNHRIKGRAAAYIRLEYDQDAFPNGMPNFSFMVRGKKVYDPRSETTAWSNNPALCVADYLCDEKRGMGCVYADEIDESALIAAANICDEDVDLAAGGTEHKYELNGFFATSSTPEEIINQMLTSMSGKAVWSGGKWRILAGAYYTPTLTFDEDDLRSGFTVQTLVSRRENFNGVKGVFVSADNNYVATDFPSILSDTAVIEDGGEEVYKNISLPFTTSATMAQRLAKIELLKARQQITLTMPLKLQGLKANVGDIIKVNNTRLGWSEKPFEVVSLNVALGEALGVDLELREISTDVFDWTTAEEQTFDPAPNTNLPNAFSVAAPTDLTITAINTPTPDGNIQSGLLVTWTPPANAFVYQYEVQYIRGASNFDWGSVGENATTSTNYGLITSDADSGADYGSITDTTTTGETNYNSVFVTTPYYVITNAVAGTEYAVRVRSINTLGVRSAFVTSNETTYGDQTAPNVPSSIVAYGDYKQIIVTWVNPTVSDFDYVEVYRNTTDNSGTATLVGVLRGSRFVDAPLGINITRYYWLKSVDRTGNKSAFSSSVSATTEFVDSDSFSQEVLNLFAEAGAYGIEPVATLPATGDFDGQIKYDTTNNKLYRWDATNTVWTDDIFSITSGSVNAESFATGIEPVKIVDELPNPSGYTGPSIVFLTTDNKIYRYTGSAWDTSVAAADIAGTLGSSNFSQSLRPVEVVSALPSSGNFQGRTVVLTSDNKIYRYTGSAWTAAVPTTDLSGTISAGQIAAGAITAGKIAADAVTAGTIAAGAVGTDQLAANAITAGKIAAGAISSDQLASSSVIADKIASGAITADKIVANTITGGLLATSGIITSAAQINDAVITNAKISNGAITTAKIGDAAITNAKIEDGAIQTAKIADAQITSAKISDLAVSTAKIQDNAVIVPYSSSSAGFGTSIVVTIGSDDVNSSGLINLNISAIINYVAGGSSSTDGGYNIPPRMFIRRNGTRIREARMYSTAVSYMSFSIATIDTVAPGTYTYDLETTMISSYVSYVTSTTMTILGVKK